MTETRENKKNLFDCPPIQLQQALGAILRSPKWLFETDSAKRGVTFVPNCIQLSTEHSTEGEGEVTVAGSWFINTSVWFVVLLHQVRHHPLLALWAATLLSHAFRRRLSGENRPQELLKMKYGLRQCLGYKVCPR